MGIFDEIKNPRAKEWRTPESFEEIVSEFDKELQERIAQDLEDEYRFIEEMLERSLVDPEERGIFAVRCYDGLLAHLCEGVPYGNVYMANHAGFIDDVEKCYDED